MKELHKAAHVADLIYANDKRRQVELDELVADLKRIMIDAMARKNDFAAPHISTLLDLIHTLGSAAGC